MSEWNQYKLSDVTTILGDGLHGTPQYCADGSFYFVNGNNLVDGKIEIKDSTKRVSEDEANKYRKNLNHRTILVSINGTIGNVAKYRGEPCVLGKSACYFNVLECFDLDFIYYVVASAQFKSAITHLATGTTIKNVSLETMRNYSFVAPRVEEQKKIAAILSSLDEKIETNRKINARLEELAQALFKSWFIDFEPFGGKMPEDWEVLSFDDAIEVIAGGTPKTEVKEYWNGDIPWISVKDFVNEKHFVMNTERYISRKGLENSSTHLLNPGDTIISARGTVGAIAQIQEPMAFNQSCFGLRCKINNGAHWLFYLIHNKVTELKQKSHGSVFDTINRKTLSDLQIVVPTSEILSKFHFIISPIVEKSLFSSKESSRLAELRDTLLPKLMSGELIPE